ncbi:MAG: lamin tail domain-containing protein, partial [Verrucomicrobiota bacterium]
RSEPFLGASGIRLDWPIRDPTIQREHLMYWLLDQYKLPNNYRRYIHYFINGVRRQGNHGILYEDTQRPNRDLIREWYPDESEGELYKTDPWFEATPAGDIIVSMIVRPLLQSFTNNVGEKKKAYYRFNWKPRSIDRSADDYTNLFCMIDAANISGPAYESNLAGIIDMENWMRTFAMNDIASFWDSFGNVNSKNAYLYNPDQTGWKILSWDFDVGLGAGIGIAQEQPTAPLFGTGVDPTIVRMFNTPSFVRHYWRALDEAVNSFFDAAGVTPFLTDRFTVFQNNGIGAVSPFVPSGVVGLSVTDFITQRRAYIMGELAAVNAPFAVDGPGALVVTQNLLRLTGTAPLNAESLVVNDIPYPVTWLTETDWAMNIPLNAGVNMLNISAFDGQGAPLPGASQTINADFTGTVPDPTGWVVINEIMFQPDDEEAEYIEIHNRSGTTSFDLSNWEFDGLGYTFPPGSIITNGQFLVLVKRRLGFAKSFGLEVPVFDEYGGTLRDEGETLMLLSPGGTAVVDQVSYDNTLPWPATGGNALELLDPAGDNARAAIWIGLSFTPGASNSAAALQQPIPPLWLSEVQPDNQTGIIDNFGEREPWVEIHNSGTNALSLDGFFLSFGFSNLTEWAFPTSAIIQPGAYRVIWSDGEPGETTGTNWHTNFRLDPLMGSVVLSRTVTGTPEVLDVITYQDVPPDQSFGSYPPGQLCFRQTFPIVTPGTGNNPAFPPVTVSINEWMASNQGAVPDPADAPIIAYDDWFEFYNPSTNTVDLSGYYLTDNPGNITKFTIPPGVTLSPGGFLMVWADEQSAQTQTNGDLHVNFKLSGGGEAIQLRAPDLTVVDAVTFGPQSANISEGRFPNGNPAPFFSMTPFTPSASNLIDIQPIVISDIAEASTNTVLLIWDSRPGLTYRVEYTDDLLMPVWLPLPGDVTATADTSMKLDTPPVSRRYYRVLTGF